MKIKMAPHFGFLSLFVRHRGLFIALLILSTPHSLFAEEPESLSGYPSLESIHDAVQDSVRGAAGILDNFFSDEEFEQERNDTSLRLRFDTQFDENDDTAFQLSPRLRLRLPAAKRTLLFQVQGASEAVDEEGGIERRDLFKGQVEDEPLELSLRLFEGEGRALVTPEVGVGIEDDEPKAFAGGRVRYQWRFGDDWSLLASERLRAHTNRGLESISLLRADTFVWEDVLWRNDAQVRWREDEAGIRYGPASAFYIPLDERSALAFEGSLLLTTEPDNDISQIATTVRYRRKVLTDWSIVEIAPGLDFESSEDFRPSGSFLVRLELEF